MPTLADRTGAGPAPFLLIQGLIALVGGGAPVTRKASVRFYSLITRGLGEKAGSRADARAVPPGFPRVLGGFFAVGGPVALPVALFAVSGG
ncbi:hypothetical protein ACFXAE_26700 [Streptomyces sp. NPDC059454]|uniref:hypothetical protein n=1 Tax=Streptomyces sp. NPDC059454 TaxID=3346836 RepID=UPI0036CB75BC